MHRPLKKTRLKVVNRNISDLIKLCFHHLFAMLTPIAEQHRTLQYHVQVYVVIWLLAWIDKKYSLWNTFETLVLLKL